MVPALMRIDGVIDNPSRMQRKPRINPSFVIFGCIVISIIIMVISWTHKQGVLKDAQMDHKAGGE